MSFPGPVVVLVQEVWVLHVLVGGGGDGLECGVVAVVGVARGGGGGGHVRQVVQEGRGRHGLRLEVLR